MEERSYTPVLVDAFVRSVVLKRDEVPDFGAYPFSIPAIRGLEKLDLDPTVTPFAGENEMKDSPWDCSWSESTSGLPPGPRRHVATSDLARGSRLEGLVEEVDELTIEILWRLEIRKVTDSWKRDRPR
jgi:hypothetical protein